MSVERAPRRVAAKRPHKKSKNGCRTCRTRRVKCDEVHPLCGPCRKHAICCYYDRPNPNAKTMVTIPTTTHLSAFSPQSEVSTNTIEIFSGSASRKSSAGSPMHDLRPPPWFGCPDRRTTELQLMNYWTYVNSSPSSIDIEPGMRNAWAFEIPQKAVTCDFLMRALLSYAALHIHVHNPHDAAMAHTSHQYFGHALRGLSSSVSRVSDVNADVVFATSVLIALQAHASWLDPCCRHDVYQLPIQWLTMGRGLGSVLRAGHAKIRSTGMNAMLHPNYIPVQNEITDGVLQPPKFLSLFHNGMMCDVPLKPDEVALTKTLRYLEYLFGSLATPERPWFTRRRLFLFPMILETEYIDLLAAHDPRALCMLAYYFGTMKLCEGHWWYDGRARHEVTGIAALLPPEWREKIAWPLAVLDEPGLRPPPWTELRLLIPILAADAPRPSSASASSEAEAEAEAVVGGQRCLAVGEAGQSSPPRGGCSGHSHAEAGYAHFRADSLVQGY